MKTKKVIILTGLMLMAGTTCMAQIPSTEESSHSNSRTTGSWKTGNNSSYGSGTKEYDPNKNNDHKTWEQKQREKEVLSCRADGPIPEGYTVICSERPTSKNTPYSNTNNTPNPNTNKKGSENRKQ